MKMQARILLSLAVVLAIMGMAGCGHYVCSTTFGAGSCTASGGGLGQGGGGGTAFFYFLNDGLQGHEVEIGLSQLTFNANSNPYVAISDLAQPPLPTSGVQDGGMVVVNKKYLYATFYNGTLYGYSISGTEGALTSVVTSPDDHYTVQGGNSIATDPAGNYVFIGDFSTGDISVYAVNQTDGTLSLVGVPVDSGVFPAQMSTDGSGKFLYVTEGQGGQNVAVMSISQGVLSPITNSPFVLNMTEMYGESSGKYMLGITQQSNDNHIYSFSIGSDGSLTPVSGSPFQTTSSPINFAVHPNGTWVYTFNLDLLDNALPTEGFTLNSDGSLQVLGGSPFSSVQVAAGQFEQGGQYLFGITQTIINGHAVLTSQPYPVDTGTGALSLSSAIGPGGFPDEGSFVVTDSPTN